MSAPLTVRPVPIQDAFRTVTGATQFLGSVAAILVGYGVLTLAQGNGIIALLGTIPGLVTLVTDLVRAFRVSAAIAEAETLVTPIADPAIEIPALGGLVSLVPDPEQLPGAHRRQ